MSNLSTILSEIRDLNAYQLARMADVHSPDSLESPGAKWLEGVRDDIVERVEYDSSLVDTGHPDGDVAYEVADAAVEIYTYQRWLVFTDLCMWEVDIEDIASGTGDVDMTQLAGLAQYEAARTLAYALLEDIAERTSDDDGETCEVCGGDLDDGDEPGEVQVDGRMVAVCSEKCTEDALAADGEG